MTEPKKFFGLNFFSALVPPLKFTSLQGVPPCSPLPSPTLKWQVIAPLQLGRKEQEGTCDLEGRLHREKNRVLDMGENGVKKNIVQELKKNLLF